MLLHKAVVRTLFETEVLDIQMMEVFGYLNQAVQDKDNHHQELHGTAVVEHKLADCLAFENQMTHNFHRQKAVGKMEVAPHNLLHQKLVVGN